MTNPRTPDIIMMDADALGATDLIWEVIEDVLDSVHLAETSRQGNESLEIWATVTDYVSTHYGDD